MTISDSAGAGELIERAMTMSGPVFINVILEQGSCVNPKLVVNKPIEDMSPELSREELAGEMLIDLLDEDQSSK